MTKFAVNKFVSSEQRRTSRAARGVFHVTNRSISWMLMFLIAFSGILYLYLINQTATGGFDIKGIETRIEELAKDNKRLELKTAELQSLTNIEKASAKLEMVATTTIDYLPAVGSTVAVR